MKTNRIRLHRLPFFCALALQCWSPVAEGAAFSYQGRLIDGGNPASGSFDLTFALFSSPNDSTQLGDTLACPATMVSNGLFSATLDFGDSAFDGNARWLEIAVRPAGVATAFATLTPRQPLAAAPYAAYAFTSGAISVNGSVADSALSTNVARRVGGNSFSGDQAFTDGTIRIQVGPTTVIVNSDGTVAITSTTNITFSTSGDLSLGGRDVSLKATRNLSVNAVSTGLTNSTSLNIRGTTVGIQADASLNVKSSGPATVQAGANLDLKGALINLN